MKRQACAAIIAIVSSMSLYAQEGRLSLGSTKDQKGYWEIRPGLGGAPRAADVPFQPWAKALYDYRQSRTDLYPPLVRCKPAGGPGFFNAPGFEIVTVTTKNGQSVIGTLTQRDDTGVQVKTGENEVTLIAAADIKSVDSAPSAMPELAAVVLSKSEIRNLVATVASLKTPAQPAKKTLRALQQLDAE